MKKIITEPLVSIIVRTCNRPFVLRRALDSILAQTYPALEIILVDDGRYNINAALGSALQKQIPSKVITTGQKGRSAAGNEGIRHARGQFVIFLDDDDAFYPDHVKTLVNGVLHHQTIVYSDCEMSREEYDEKNDAFEIKKQWVAFSQDFNRGLLFARNYIPLMTLCFPADLLEKAGGFDESVDLYEDWDLLLRLSFLTQFVHIPVVTAKYRKWSDNQITEAKNAAGSQVLPQDKKTAGADYVKVAARYINKMTPEDLYQIFLYSEKHFQQQDEMKEEIRQLKEEIRQLKEEIRQLKEENLSLKKKHLSNQELIQEKTITLQQIMKEKAGLEKQEIYSRELQHINQLYVDENLRKEEYIAKMEHKMQSLTEKLKTSCE